MGGMHLGHVHIEDAWKDPGPPRASSSLDKHSILVLLPYFILWEVYVMLSVRSEMSPWNTRAINPLSGGRGIIPLGGFSDTLPTVSLKKSAEKLTSRKNSNHIIFVSNPLFICIVIVSPSKSGGSYVSLRTRVVVEFRHKHDPLAFVDRIWGVCMGRSQHRAAVNCWNFEKRLFYPILFPSFLQFFPATLGMNWGCKLLVFWKTPFLFNPLSILDHFFPSYIGNETWSDPELSLQWFILRIKRCAKISGCVRFTRKTKKTSFWRHTE